MNSMQTFDAKKEPGAKDSFGSTINGDDVKDDSSENGQHLSHAGPAHGNITTA